MRLLLFTIATALLFSTSSFEKPHKKPSYTATLYASCTTCGSEVIHFNGTGYPNSKEIFVRYQGQNLPVAPDYATSVGYADKKGNISFDRAPLQPGYYEFDTYYKKAGNIVFLAWVGITVE